MWKIKGELLESPSRLWTDSIWHMAYERRRRMLLGLSRQGRRGLLLRSFKNRALEPSSAKDEASCCSAFFIFLLVVAKNGGNKISASGISPRRNDRTLEGAQFSFWTSAPDHGCLRKSKLFRYCFIFD